MNSAGDCEFLQWDSSFFGCRIARVNATQLTSETAQSIVEWSSLNRIDCLYLTAASDDPETARIAEANGFDLVDVRLTFALELSSAPVLSPVVRPHCEADVPALKFAHGASDKYALSACRLWVVKKWFAELTVSATV